MTLMDMCAFKILVSFLMAQSDWADNDIVLLVCIS